MRSGCRPTKSCKVGLAYGSSVGGCGRKHRGAQSREYLPLYLGLHLARSKLRDGALNYAQKRFENLARQVADEIKQSPETKHKDNDRLPGDQDKMTYIEALTYCDLGTAVAITRREGGFDDALMHIGKARAAAAEISNEVTRLKWLGLSDRCEGEVLLRQGEAAKAAPSSRAHFGKRPMPTATGF